MQFKVPQFLDIEDKIFGPFTFRQFAYLTGGIGICFILYKAIGLLFGAIPILLVAGLAGALAFYRPNNKPFINMLEAGAKYMTQDKLYIWKRRTEFEMEKSKPKEREVEVPQAVVKLEGNKLRDLAWSLDILDLKK